MTASPEIMMRADYLSGSSLEVLAAKYAMPRSRVVAMLKASCIGLRTAAQSRHMTQQRMTPDQRRRNTQVARQRFLAERGAQGRRAQVVRVWCEQNLSPQQAELMAELNRRHLDAKAHFPAGEVNVWVAMPHALVAIVPVQTRTTAASRQRMDDVTRYLTGRGFFVVHYSGQLTDLELDTIEAMSRSRMGAPVDLTQKSRIKASLSEALERLHQDYREAVELAHRMFAEGPKQAAAE